MKWLKRILSTAVCLGLLLSGCGSPQEPSGSSFGSASSSSSGSSGGTVAMGRYVEKVLSTPQFDAEGQYSIIKRDNGDLEMMARLYGMTGETYEIHHTKDGQQWEKKDMPWLEQIKASETGFSRIGSINAWGENGYVVVIKDATERLRLYRSEDGTSAEEIPVLFWDKPYEKMISDGNETAGYGGQDPSQQTMGTMSRSTGVYPLDNGDILIIHAAFDGIPAIRVNPETGEIVKQYPLRGYHNTFKDGKIYTLCEDGIETYDIETAEMVDKIEENYSYDSVASSYDTYLDVDSNGAVYTASKRGILRRTAGGSIWETLADGKQFSMNMPSMGIGNFLYDGDGGFYILYTLNGGGVKLIHYAYDENMPTVPDTELVVYGLQDNRTIRQAIGEFQQSHPNVFIQYQAAMDGDSSATLTDVIKALNTELIAGKGPDILLLDGLPIESYMEKGVLADLSAALEGMKDSLYGNITGAYIRDGKTLAIPARFSIPLLISGNGVKDKVDSLEKMAEIAKNPGDKPLMAFMDEGLFVQKMLTVCANDMIGQDGMIDQQAAKTFMEALKTIYDQNPPDQSDPMGYGVVTFSSSAGSSELTCELTTDMLSFNNGDTQSTIQISKGMMDFSGIAARLVFDSPENEDKDLEFTDVGGRMVALDTANVQPLLSKNVFYPGTVLGINSAGSHQDLAAEFVRTVLSLETQSMDLIDGFPVNKQAYEKQYQEYTNPREDRGGLPSFKTSEDLTAIAQSLNTPALSDQVLTDAIQEQAVAYLKGEKELDQAVADLVSATQLYLME